MKINKDDNGFEYLENLEDAIGDHKAIKVWSVLQFYRLSGRKTIIIKDNIESIPDLKYVVFSPHEKKYYLREFRDQSLDRMFFYKRTLEFSGEDESIENLWRYIDDGRVWMLMTPEQVGDITTMLTKLWKSQYVTSGKLSYRSWINLLEQSLRLDDYKENCKNLTGFLTVCKQFENRIRGIWEEAYKSISETPQKR